jgi:hypothetical protein
MHSGPYKRFIRAEHRILSVDRLKRSAASDADIYFHFHEVDRRPFVGCIVVLGGIRERGTPKQI